MEELTTPNPELEKRITDFSEKLQLLCKEYELELHPAIDKYKGPVIEFFDTKK